jgi:phytoene synthase
MSARPPEPLVATGANGAGGAPGPGVASRSERARDSMQALRDVHGRVIARDAPGADRAELAACRAALANGSRTFLAASRLLPREVREPACALYAFCRMADDLVDGAGAQGTAAAVAELRERLAMLYAGRPAPYLADRAMAAVVRQFGLPIAWPAALIEGFAWDAQGRRYETLDDVLAYAARVAGSVGAMMGALMRVPSRDALARACDLGVAMQLSNIARDVGEDAAMGRLYLPRAWMRDAGIDPEAFVASPRFTPALASVVLRLLREAEHLYARAGAGVAELPLACRPGIGAARTLYRQIGLEVLRRGGDSVNGRAVVSAPRKLAGVAIAACTLWPSRSGLHEAPLEANTFLVDAWSDAPDMRAATTPAWWHVRTRLERIVLVLERTEHRARRPREWSALVGGR